MTTARQIYLYRKFHTKAIPGALHKCKLKKTLVSYYQEG